VVQQWRPPVEPPEEAQAEWYEVDAYETYIGTLETALYIERHLDRLPEPDKPDSRDNDDRFVVVSSITRVKANYCLARATRYACSDAISPSVK